MTVSRMTEWTEAQTRLFQESLLNWYQTEQRLLPWRENTDPYRVWVSEIMLQQTQVATVIPYFLRFMEWFPSIQALAEAPEDRLLKAWEGLGYYSRVRNMQTAAKQIMTDYGGKMPKRPEDISALKGIGPYTAGAIASICFHLPEPAVDGNVMRIYSRLFSISDDIAQAKTRKIFEEKVRQTISPTQPGDFNQALMDLGATVCTPTSPKCDICPLAAYCSAHHAGRMTDYPVKTKKPKPVPVYYLAQVIQNSRGECLLEQRNSQGVLSGMWTFPLHEVTKAAYRCYLDGWRSYQQSKEAPTLFDLVAEDDGETQGNAFLEELGSQAVWQKQPVGEVTHIFSHLKWFILLASGFERAGSELTLKENQRWVAPEDFAAFVFPKPQQKMVALLFKNNILKSVSDS